MSTYGHSLYRPIKISDILDLGFEIYDHEEKLNCIRIKSEKLGDHLEWDILWHKTLGFEHEVREYYYLFLGEYVNHKSQDCVWGFTRYNVNSPALNFLLEGLHNKGYKLKVEGERYDNPYWLEQRKLLKKHLAESK